MKKFSLATAAFSLMLAGQAVAQTPSTPAAQTPSTWRIRYYNIAPDTFSWAADRSTDGGKTWRPVFDIVFRPHPSQRSM